MNKTLADDCKYNIAPIDGDIDRLVKLVDQAVNNPSEFLVTMAYMKAELSKLKPRIVWDSYADEMGKKRALEHYGARP